MKDHSPRMSAEDPANTLERFADASRQQNSASRRSALRTLGKLGLGAAAALSVSTFGLRPRKALAQSGDRGPVDVLNFALTLEYLESVFYNKGLDTSGLIPSGAGRNVYGIIAEHENAHVDFLKSAVNGLGGTPAGPFTEDDFDFTVGGAFPTFSDYATFLALSQAFEDTGVRAYKGQAKFLTGVQGALTPALQIHAVEARHAAEVRRIRASMGADQQPWITNDSRDGLPEATQATYDGEGNTMQAGLDVTNLGNGFSNAAASEAFDEPLSTDAVLAIADIFVNGDLDGDGDD